MLTTTSTEHALRGTEAVESEHRMAREYKVGTHIIFVDAYGNSHDALVTAWHGELYEHQGVVREPVLNMVFVSSDELRRDRYGRQIEREPTSVVHSNEQQAHGNYWKWPDE